jgi:hypothetical protein
MSLSWSTRHDPERVFPCQRGGVGRAQRGCRLGRRTIGHPYFHSFFRLGDGSTIAVAATEGGIRLPLGCGAGSVALGFVRKFSVT